MSRRHVHNGVSYRWTRLGWKPVPPGGSRKRKRRRRQPTEAPVIETVAPSIPLPRSQWGGKYDALRTEHVGNDMGWDRSGPEPFLLDTLTGPRNSEATFKAGSGSSSVKTFETQDRPTAAEPPGRSSVPVS
jgi:hypothetical protein